MSRIFFYTVSFFLLFLISLFSFLDFFLPSYLESEFLPKIAREFGVYGFSCKVRKTGFYGADLGSIKISDKSDKDDPFFTMESMRVDYSPSGLLKKRIKKISFTGINFFCQYEDGNFKIKGLNIKAILSKIASRKKKTPVSADKSFFLPVEKIKIRDSIITCDWNGKKYRLPVDLEFLIENQKKIIICTISLYPRGQSIIFSGIIDPLDNKIRLTFNADSIELERYADIVNLISGDGTFQGRGAISGTADLQMDPFKILLFSAKAQFLESNILYRNFQIHNSENNKKPIEIKIISRGGENWNFSLSPFNLVSPAPITISDFKGFLKVNKKDLETGADFNVIIENNKSFPGINSLSFASCQLQMSAFAFMKKKGNWNFKLSNKPCKNNKWNIKTDGFDITFNEPSMNLSGDGEYSFGSVMYDLAVKNIYGIGKSGNIRINELSTAGKIKKDEVNPFCFNGIIKIDNCSITDSDEKVKLLGIKGNIPVKWPCEKFGEKGEIQVKEVILKNLKTGSILSSVRQKNKTLFLKGEYKNSLINDLLMKFNGYSGISSSGDFDMMVDFNIRHKYGTEDINISRFLSGQKDIIVNGDLDVKGGVAINKTGLNCFLAGTLYNGKFLMPDNSIEMSGINASCIIPELIKMRSAGLQKFSFKKASFGNTLLNNGEIIFNIESADSIFIEKISAEYCRGKVFTHAIRISSGKNDYDLILFFDRLSLAMLLKNLGIGKTEGEGTVNGRLPVMLNNDQIIFGDGFLYSTPGVGGNIRLTGTQVLTSGIPEGTLQHAQLELAREALKDYKYEWVKLSLITKEENLLLKMQLAGKPVKALPFVYKKELGGFVKVESKGKGSVFQGIGIDVNFSLPLNRLMKYGKGINSLFDLIKKPKK